MGMFDYVDCKAPLPDGKPTPPDLFQTKDFELPYMELYTITGEGRLVHHHVEYESVKDDTRPLGWYLKPKSERDIDLNFHGTLNFYDYNLKTDESREFNAKFTAGNLVEILSVPAPPDGN